jgi:hypothetical protein
MGKTVLALLAIFTSSANSSSPFTGTWEGRMNDQPAIELTIHEENGKTGGAIVFYFQRRGKDGKWQVEGGKNPIPLLMPNIKGKSLTFEVTHHKRHGGSELGPNVQFRMELTGADTAALYKTDEAPDGGPGLKLTRRK